MPLLKQLTIERSFLALEIGGLLRACAMWIMLLILAPLVGYGFIEAVNLYSEASRSAVNFPELAKGMAPLEGVMVPAFGAFYLAMTLLFPFVAIRLIGNEKQSGALKILLQLLFSPTRIIAFKLMALFLVWLISLIPVLSALVLWKLVGGHIYWPELLNLLLGYGLYALVIIGIAFFAGAITDTTATAAIVTMAFTLGSWVLDFASSSPNSWISKFSFLSLTSSLRVFEHGLFDLGLVARQLIMACALLSLTVIWLHTGTHLKAKLKQAAIVMVFALVLGILWSQAPVYSDVTENRRNSFNPADERALEEMRMPLKITVYLNPDDNRLKEFEQNVLVKLRRTVPNLTVTYGNTNKAELFRTTGEDNYGLIVYDYAGKQDQSRSNSPREILPLLHKLAGQRVIPDKVPDYPGYPLVVKTSSFGVWFYIALPVLTLLIWLFNSGIPKKVLGGTK